VHQDRAEFGPRALGNRSIIASAFFPEMKERLNTLIKKREPYRPYAPAIAVEIAYKYFGADVLTYNAHHSHPLRYMASVVKTNTAMRKEFPSAVHYDLTARVQLLSSTLNPLLHSLSLHLEDNLGCGILLNTSFNLGYEALVGDPISAVNTLSWSHFDAALLGDYAIVFQ
jgi:carbamoyltransferase